MVALQRLTRKKWVRCSSNKAWSLRTGPGRLRLQNQQGILFGEALVNGVISEDKIVITLLAQFGLPYLSPCVMKYLANC